MQGKCYAEYFGCFYFGLIGAGAVIINDDSCAKEEDSQ